MSSIIAYKVADTVGFSIASRFIMGVITEIIGRRRDNPIYKVKTMHGGTFHIPHDIITFRTGK